VITQRKTELQKGQKVIIIWTKKHHFVELEGTFVAYVKSVYSKDTPLFITKVGDITGESCFWILKEQVRSKKELLYYQNMIIPLQIKMANQANKEGIHFVEKIKYKEVQKMAKEKIEQHNRFKNFIRKYGFDPTDDSWLEAHMAENETERKWFSFTREQNMPLITEELASVFNSEQAEKISYEQALEMTKKKIRYALGSKIIRMKGESNIDKWKEDALAFERQFKAREERMAEWARTNEKKERHVKTLKPVEFWYGNILMRCIEKIPDIFTSPDCEHIKPGVELDVLEYDPVEKWIKLDFLPAVKEQLKAPADAHYAIVIHPENIGHLEGVDRL